MGRPRAILLALLGTGCGAPPTFAELRAECGLDPGQHRFLDGRVGDVALERSCTRALSDTLGADRDSWDDPAMDWVHAGAYFILATDFGPIGDLPPPPRSPAVVWEAAGGATDLDTAVGAQFLGLLRTRVARTVVHDIGDADARFTSASGTLWVPPAGAPDRAVYDAAAILLHETGHADDYGHVQCDSGEDCDPDGAGPNGVEVAMYWTFGAHLDHGRAEQHAVCDTLVHRIALHCDRIEDASALAACGTAPARFCAR